MTPSNEEQSPMTVKNMNENKNEHTSPDKYSETNESETSEQFGSMEDMIASEENNVMLLLDVTIRIAPLFLGSEGVKKNKDGSCGF